MTDPTPYLNNLIFYVEFVPVGELFSHVATVYHETKESIKKYIAFLEVRNNWKCLSVKYKDYKTGTVKDFKEWQT